MSRREPGAGTTRATPNLKFVRNVLLDEVQRRDDGAEAQARRAWNTIARAVDGPRWEKLAAYNPFKALRVLASAAAGEKRDVPGYRDHELTEMFDRFLETEANRGWTQALVRVAEAYGNRELLQPDSTSNKIRRNLGEGKPDLGEPCSRVLGVVWPEAWGGEMRR